MSISVQQRGQRFQLRVKHKLLPRPFFFTFDDEQAARDYGHQLHALLQRGIVPAELLAAPAKREDDPLLAEILRAYLNGCPALTASDDALLSTMVMELAGLRLSAVTYAWAEQYVSDCKVKRHHAPGTIRKRVGALARVLDWHHRRTSSTAANPMRLLPRGYSHYTSADQAALPATRAPKTDTRRDRRLLAGEADKIRAAMDADLALLFDVIVWTGLRLREAYRLRVDQVDLERHVLRVEGSKGVRGALKPRVVPIVPELRAALAERCRGRVGLLWAYWDGDPAKLDAVTSRLSYLFTKAFTAAGVAGLVEHDLRHEAACRWFERRDAQGRWVFSDVEVARIMGWSNLAMALRYASLRGEDLAARLG